MGRVTHWEELRTYTWEELYLGGVTHWEKLLTYTWEELHLQELRTGRSYNWEELCTGRSYTLEGAIHWLVLRTEKGYALGRFTH